MTLTTEQFLSQILPTSNLYCAASINPTNRADTKLVVCKTLRDIAVASLQADADGRDAYFAMAGFEKGWHPDPLGRTKANGDVKKVFRTQQNATHLKSFWLDLDCGVGKDYPNQGEAVNAVRALLKATGLPMPLLVNSGNGIHCYWVLSQQIPANMWKKIACLFAGVVAHTGMLTDSQCTCDEARVLRVPGTSNYKNGMKKPVAALTPLMPVDPIAFTTTIKNYAVAHGVKPVNIARQENQAPDNIRNNPVLNALWQNGNFQAVMGHTFMTERNKDAVRIVTNCEQVRTAGHQLYPNWFNMMTVMNCCPDGKEIARRLSAEDKRFEEFAFSRKYDHDVALGSNGPASCNSFDMNNPGTCANCPFFGKIRTPAELGRVPVSEQYQAPTDPAAPVAPVTVEVQAPIAQAPVKTLDIKGFTAFPLDDTRYLMREGAGLFHVWEEEVEGTDTKIKKERSILDSCFYLLYAVRTNLGKTDQQMTYIFQITNPHDKPRQASMSSKDIGEQAIKNWLFNNQIYPEPRNEKLVVDCMRTYLAKLQRKIPCMDMKENFGWSITRSREGAESNTFVLGDRILSPNQPHAEVALPPKLQRYAEDKIYTAGTLEDWKEVPAFYEKHNIIWGQFGIALAFAAPLMRYAPGIAQNGIVNFWSRQSGTGKTTLQQAINSVWGHPEKQLLNVQSTMNSRFSVMGMRHALPVCLNEITNLSDVELSEMLFQMSEGREKDRLGDGGASMLQSGSWKTITIMSANNTVFDKMQALSRDRDGEIKRVLELEVNMAGTSQEMADVMAATMNKNFGVAGEFFIQTLLNDPALLEMIPKAMSAWVAKHSAGQDERYWMNTIAAAVVAATLTNKMGLTNIDIPAIVRYAMDMVVRTRSNMVDSRSSMDTALFDYLMHSLRDTLIVESATNPMKNSSMPDFGSGAAGYVRRMPQGSLGVRIEMKERMMYVSVSHLNEWCSQNRMSPELVVKDHLVHEDKRTKRMGTGVSSLPQGPVRCWFIRVPEELDVASMGDATDESVQ